MHTAVRISRSRLVGVFVYMLVCVCVCVCVCFPECACVCGGGGGCVCVCVRACYYVAEGSKASLTFTVKNSIAIVWLLSMYIHILAFLFDKMIVCV